MTDIFLQVAKLVITSMVYDVFYECVVWYSQARSRLEDLRGCIMMTRPNLIILQI